MNLFSHSTGKKSLFDIAYILLNGSVGVFLRRAYYINRARWIDAVPHRLRQTLALSDRPESDLWLEIGSGLHPTPGYIHLDSSRWLPHVELVGPANRIPLPSESVSRLLGVHVLEHVPPRTLRSVLAEWHRVLKPGGVLQVHVPDVVSLAAAYASAPLAVKWALSSAIYGCYGGPNVSSPDDVPQDADHQTMFDVPALEAVLKDAGFTDFADVTQDVHDRHDDAWKHIVPKYSIVARARRVH